MKRFCFSRKVFTYLLTFLLANLLPCVAQDLDTLWLRYGHGNAYITDLQFSPTGDTLRSFAGKDVVVWNTHTGEILRRWDVRGYSGAKFSPDGRYLLAYDNNTNPSETTLYLWDVKQETLMTENKFVLLKPNDSYIYDFAFSPDGRSIAVGSQYLTFVSIPSLEIIAGYEQKYQYKILSADLLCFSPDGKYLAINAEFPPFGSGHKRLGILDTAKETLEYDIQGTFGAFSPDKKYFVTKGGEVSLYETATGKLIRKLADKTPGIPDFYGGIRSVCFTPGMKYIVTEEYRHRGIYYVDTTKLLRQYVGQTGSVVVRVSPDSNYIAEGGIGSYVSVSRTPWTLTSVPDYQLGAGNNIKSIFPNPAENIVTVEFTISEQYAVYPVSIHIIDTLGRVVLTPIIEQKYEGGEHSLAIDTGSLASGTYRCQLMIDGQTFTQTFTIVR